MLARDVVNGLGGNWMGSYGVAPCPICQPERRADQRALSVIQKSDRIVLTCFKGCEREDVETALNITKEQREPPRRDYERERIEREERRKKQEEVSIAAKKMLESAKLKPHEYFLSKGIRKAVPVLPNGCAIFAVSDANYKIWSAQLIRPDGTKRFLKGGRLKGCAVRFGFSGPIILCEGVATGLSIYFSMKIGCGAQVFCCASGAGIVSVARSRKADLVCADHDEPRYPKHSPKYGAGEWAAIKTGLPYVMPPTPGDFNDMEQTCGSDAVWKTISEKLF